MSPWLRPRATRAASFAIAALALAMAAPPARAALPTGFADQTLVPGLDFPVGMAFLPDGRLLLTEQFSGNVRMVVSDTLSGPDPVLTVPNLDTGFGEQGLLGIAVDPGWPARPYVYFHYDHSPDSHIWISRYTFTGDLSDGQSANLVGDPASRYDLLTDLPDNAGNHNGGTLRFGPDDMLYVSLGEDAVPCAAQDTSSMRGVIMRLEVSQLPAGPGGPPPKGLITPADNPYPGAVNSNRRLIWAIGLRNPFRFHIDPANGDLFIGDVGQNRYEEIDWATQPALDFGWPFREGPIAYSTCPITPAPFTDPIASYDRTGFSAAIISAGIYRQPADTCRGAFPADYEGTYFYLEYYQGFMRRIRYNGSAWVPAPAPGQPNGNDWATGLASASDFLVGPDGALWYLRQFGAVPDPGSGSLHRIVSSIVDCTSPPPGERLLQLGPAHPNPTAATASVVLRLGRPASLEVSVHDLSGREVRSLFRGAPMPAGPLLVTWDGKDGDGRELPAGLYVIEFRAGPQRESRRVALVR